MAHWKCTTFSTETEANSTGKVHCTEKTQCTMITHFMRKVCCVQVYSTQKVHSKQKEHLTLQVQCSQKVNWTQKIHCTNLNIHISSKLIYLSTNYCVSINNFFFTLIKSVCILYSIRCQMFFVHCSLPSPSREVCAVANYPALANWGILIIQLARKAGCIASFFTELAPSPIQSIGCDVYGYLYRMSPSTAIFLKVFFSMYSSLNFNFS